MVIKFLDYKQSVDKSRADVRNQLQEVDPTVFGTVVRALSDAVGSRVYDIFLLLQQLLNQLFPQTASGTFLENWAEYENLQRLPATGSSGFVIFTGTVGTLIPTDTLIIKDGIQYAAVLGKSISALNQSISALTYSSGVATATSNNHGLTPGLTVNISGTTETEYNGDVVILETPDKDTFTYSVDGTPTSPATGSPQFSINMAKVEFEANATGISTNKNRGSSVSFVTPITNIDTTGYVGFDGLTGGSDTETDDELRLRIFQSRRNILSNFNTASIERQARLVAGVTDVFVKPITPNVGDVTVYFLRRNDSDGIVPDTSEITEVKNSILKILPAPSDPSNIYVLAPTLVETNFTFSAISPDTPTMRTAVENSLKALFEDEVEFETNLVEDKYRSAIINTQDLETGEFLDSFTLSTPSGDISVSTGEIASLGDVTFS